MAAFDVENAIYSKTMRPVFADPKTDFVFKRIFGRESQKNLLIELLNAFLELDESDRIVDLEYLTPEQTVPVPELKLSIVDVKCIDAQGRHYVVEMQVLNVEGFEKRVVYNASKAYVLQLRGAEDYPRLRDVVGVTVCDFELFLGDSDPNSPESKAAPVPMLSRWRMQEQHSGAHGLPQVQYVFLELPKYTAGADPQSFIDHWAYFFREAKNLEVVPTALQEGPFREALEVARMATFTALELDAYDRAKMAEQDARGALSLAAREGHERGLEEGREKGLEEGRTLIVQSILLFLESRDVEVTQEARARLLACRESGELQRWLNPGRNGGTG